MLNIEVNRSAKGVEQYFDCELAVSDYLMKESGIWAGRGAERLGLRGPVQRWQFVALLRNEDPTTGQTADGTYEYEPAGARRKGQQPAGRLWASCSVFPSR
jgi:TrwC relaxase